MLLKNKDSLPINGQKLEGKYTNTDVNTHAYDNTLSAVLFNVFSDHLCPKRVKVRPVFSCYAVVAFSESPSPCRSSTFFSLFIFFSWLPLASFYHHFTVSFLKPSSAAFPPFSLPHPVFLSSLCLSPSNLSSPFLQRFFNFSVFLPHLSWLLFSFCLCLFSFFATRETQL